MIQLLSCSNSQNDPKSPSVTLLFASRTHWCTRAAPPVRAAQTAELRDRGRAGTKVAPRARGHAPGVQCPARWHRGTAGHRAARPPPPAPQRHSHPRHCCWHTGWSGPLKPEPEGDIQPLGSVLQIVSYYGARQGSWGWASGGDLN